MNRDASFVPKNRAQKGPKSHPKVEQIKQPHEFENTEHRQHLEEQIKKAERRATVWKTNSCTNLQPFILSNTKQWNILWGKLKISRRDAMPCVSNYNALRL